MSNDPKVPQEPQAQEPTTSNCHHCHEPLRLIEGRWLDAETHPHCEGTRRLHAPFAEPAPSRLSAEAHYKAALEAIAYRAPVGISDFQQLLYHAEDTARAALSTATAPAQGWQERERAAFVAGFNARPCEGAAVGWVFDERAYKMPGESHVNAENAYKAYRGLPAPPSAPTGEKR